MAKSVTSVTRRCKGKAIMFIHTYMQVNQWKNRQITNWWMEIQPP